MAFGTKISELPAATSLTGLELTVVVQDGETRRSTVEALDAAVSQRIDAVVSAAASTNAVVSALDARVALVSAHTSVNAAAITSVNAVLSTKVNRVGDFLDTVQYIEFDTSTSIATSAGRLSWNLDDGTLNLGLIGGNVVNQLGQELVQRCYNNTGAPITEGSVVKVVGATGQRLTIELAQANNDANSLTVIGVATETIADKALGYVATEGFVRSINTHGFADGDVLWLSPTTPGALTNVKPVAPQHMVMVGYVVKGGSVGAGSIFVKVQNGYELGELHDVKVSASTSLADGEILAYNVSAGVWTNSTRLDTVAASVSSLTDRVATVSAATSVNAATVSALEIRVSAVSARASANAAALLSTNNVVSALELRVSAVSAAVSTLSLQVQALDVSAVNVRLDQVSAAVSVVNANVAALEIRVSTVSARASANAAAIVSINNVVSALEIRVSSVSTLAAAAGAAITSVNAVVSGLAARITAVSASVSTLAITLAAVSAQTSVNAAAIAATNNVVSALEIRVSAVSAAVVIASAAITSVNAVVSLKINRAGDTMTGALVLSGDPSVSLGAATKQYVDAGDRWVTIADLAITSVAQIDVTWTNGAYRVVRAQVLSYLPTVPVSGFPYVQVRAGGTWNTGASNYANQYFVMQGTAYSTNIVAGTYLNLTDNVANAAGDHATTILDIDPGPGVANGEAGFLFNTKWSGSTGRRVMWGQGAVSVGATTIDGLRFGMLGTTWAPVGRILVMGAKA